MCSTRQDQERLVTGHEDQAVGDRAHVAAKPLGGGRGGGHLLIERPDGAGGTESAEDGLHLVTLRTHDW
ncbi:hypothetical protein GCM10023317_36730 [Actinopolymorpha pittospori]